MRTFCIGLFIVFSSAQGTSQWIDVPRDVETALLRIERAFQEGTPASIVDLFPGGILMRLEDSLYQSIPSKYALEKLAKFFGDKDSIDFRFGLPGSGMMYYTFNGKRETIQIDVWLKKEHSELFIHALNISNYPTATVFYNIHPKEDQAGSKK